MKEIDSNKFIGKPLFFEHARSYRNYTGGKLIDRLLGNKDEVDCEFPEAWIASTTRADNGEGHPEDEGLSRIKLPDGSAGGYFADILPEYAAEILGSKCKDYKNFPVLCKFLDSAMRLSLQVHPDKKFAKKYFDSDYGKTECWIILGARPINGKDPYLLLGFKEGVTKNKVRDAILEEDFERLESYFHRVSVKPGDVWFLPGGLPHAIGPGVFLLEVQEPTDLIVQPELSCGEVEFSDKDRWGGLDMVEALDCFHYEENTFDSLYDRYYLNRTLIDKQGESSHYNIVGDGYDDCFHVDLLQIVSEYKLEPSSWVLAIIVKGSGRLIIDSVDYEMEQGAAVLLPAGKESTIQSHSSICESMEVYLITE